MVSLRQIAGVLWTFLGFMLVAGLVLDMRYKPVGEGTGYLDTWTGRVHENVATVGRPESARRIVVVDRSGLSVEVSEHLRRDVEASGTVRFAFPAPESRVIVVPRDESSGARSR